MDSTQLKYAGEAICLVGIAFRLLRWAFDAVREGDAAPSATDMTVAGSQPQGVGSALSALLSAIPGVQVGGPQVKTTKFSNTYVIPLSGSGSPQLPPELAAQLTPEMRAKVLDALTKAEPGSAPVHVSSVKTSFATHLGSTPGINPDLFPAEMLAAMTPEQRAKVLETLANPQAKKAG